MKSNPHMAILLAAVLGIGFSTAAQADERELLIDFYNATGGNTWHNNEGWLGPDSVCEWHGISCVLDQDDIERVSHINLEWNNLSGQLPADLDQFERLRGLNLRGNQLHGPLPPALINTMPRFADGDTVRFIIDLSENRLSGPLPEFTAASGPGANVVLLLVENDFSGELPATWAGMVLDELRLDRNAFDPQIPAAWAEFAGIQHLGLAAVGLKGDFPEALMGMTQLQTLDLSGNNLSGGLPMWLSEFSLRNLNLDGNWLDGDILPAVGAMTTESVVDLNLADNQFSGEIPAALAELSFNPAIGISSNLDQSRLNLCWNQFEEPDGELAGFVDNHHHGGVFDACQQPRQALDPTISGSWYDPSRPGEGFSQMLLDNGSLLVYWFSHALPLTVSFPLSEQTWLFTVANTRIDLAVLEPMYLTQGTFEQGATATRAVPADLRLEISPLADGQQQAAYSLGWPVPIGIGSFFARQFSGRHEQVALTRLAGSRCDNQSPNQWISGAWFNPQRTGEGFMVEVNEDGRGIVYWFTYQATLSLPVPGSGQAWMTGDAQFEDNELFIDNLLQPVGTEFGPDLDPTAISFNHWGSLRLRFDDENSGHAWFDSVFDDYGAGDFPIQRLARPMLAECGE